MKTKVRKEDPILVLDTCAILSGFSSHLSNAKQMTTPGVVNELPETLVDSSTGLPPLDVRSVEVLAPGEEYLRKADKIVKAAGDVKVSATDKSLLALSLQLRDGEHRPIVVSDDYGLQNLAKMSGIDYLPYVERGIRKQYNWVLTCPACSRQYPSSYKSAVCPICGTKLKRRTRKNRRR